MLEYPETCLISGTALLISGNDIFGYTLIGLSVVVGFFRFAIKNQEKIAKQKEAKKIIDNVTGVITNILSGYGSNVKSSGKKILH